MSKQKPLRKSFKLDRMTPEQRRTFEQMYSQGVSFREMAERMTAIMGRPISSWAVSRFCHERIRHEAERAARLQAQAHVIAQALANSNAKAMSAKTRTALQAVFFNLLNDASEENFTDVARELRELEKVDVARERVAVEKQKVHISQKQLELRNKELEARLAAARQVVAQAEQAAKPAPAAGKVVLPSDVLEKLKEAYGIA